MLLHTGRNLIPRIRITPDNKKLLAVPGDKIIEVDVKTKKLTFTRNTGRFIAPDGKTALSFSTFNDKPRCTLHDLADGSEIIGLDAVEPVVGAGPVTFAADSSRALAIGATGKETKGIIQLIQLSKPQTLTPIPIKHSAGSLPTIAIQGRKGKEVIVGFGNGAVFSFDPTKNDLKSAKAILNVFGNKAVTALALSPDGKELLTGHADGVIKLFDLEAEKEVGQFKKHTSKILNLVFVANARRAVSSGADGQVWLWDLERPTDGPDEVVPVQPKNHPNVSPGTLPGEVARYAKQEGPILAMSVSKNGRHVLAAGPSTLRLLDTQEKMIAKESKKVDSAITTLAVSPDWKRVVTGHKDGSLRLWDPNNADAHTTIKGPDRAVVALAVSPDGKLALVSYKHTAADVRLVNLVTGKEEATLDAGKAPCHCVCFTGDGKLAVAGAQRQPIMVWEVATKKPLKGLGGVNINGLLVAVGSDQNVAQSDTINATKTFDLSGRVGPRELHSFVDLKGARMLAASLDGTRLAGGKDQLPAGGERGTLVKVWDLKTNKAMAAIPMVGIPQSCLVLSADGKMLLAGSPGGTVHQFDLAKVNDPVKVPPRIPTLVKGFKGHTGSVTSIDWSKDGKYIVSAGVDSWVRVWDATTGKGVAKPVRGCLEPLNNGIRFVRFSPSGRMFVAGGAADRSEQWVTKPVSGEHKGEGTLWHTYASMAPVAVACDINLDDKRAALGIGKRVVIAEISKTATLADPIETGEIVNCVVWQPGTTNVICGDDKGSVRVFNTKNKLRIHQFEAHKGAEVTALAYQPKTNELATGGSDKTITLRMGKVNRTGALWPKIQFRRIKGHEGTITALRFTPTGKYLISGSKDKTVRMWDLSVTPPRQVGKWTLSEEVNSLALDPKGTRAIVATRSGIEMVDLTVKKP